MDNSTGKSAAIQNAVLDLRGLRCPLPAIRSRKMILTAADENSYAILTTDETAVRDIPLAVRDLGWICISAALVQAAPLPTWEIILAPHHRSCDPA